MALDRPPTGLPEPLTRFLYAVRDEIGRISGTTAKTVGGQDVSISRTAGVAAGAGVFTPNATPASKLYNLQVMAGLENIILTWQGVNQAGYDHTEIWSNNRDDLSSAVQVGTAIVGVFADNVGENQSRYYWVRAVNKIKKAGPFNKQSGTFGQTSPGTEYILDQLAGAITESQLYVDLQTKIDDSYTGVTTNTTAIAGLSAQYTVKVDVDGYVSGFGLANTLKDAAPFSEFIVLADSFAVAFPAQTWVASGAAALGEYFKPVSLPTGLYYKVTTAGTLGASEPAWPTVVGNTVTSGTAILQTVTIASSVPFIVGQVAGASTVGIDGSLVVDGTIIADAIAAGTITADKLSVADLAAVSATLGTVIGGLFATGSAPAMRTEIGSTGAYLIWAGNGTTGGSGAVFYIDTAGNAYFKGTLDAGVISGSVLNPGGLLIDCGGGRTTTFVISSVDNKTFFRAKKGSAGAVTLDLGTYYGPAHGTGYYSGRFAWQQMDVFIDYALNGDWGAVTTKIDVQYDAGAWENIYSFKTDCDYRGGANGSLIYTTKNTAWGTMAVRVTTDGNTQSASGRVVVINLAQSTQIPDTVHNTTGDTSDPGVTRTLDDVTQGTSYHKSSSTYVDTAGKHIAVYDDVHLVTRTGGFVGDGAFRASAGFAADGTLTPAFHDLNLLKNRTADKMTYTVGGATVDSLKPGEAGANKTETHTSADTSNVNGRAASDIRSGVEAGSGNLLDADAGAIQTGGFAYYTGFGTGANGMSIANLGLAVGDAISWGGRVWSTVNDSSNLRFAVQFIDASNATISTTLSSLISGATSPTVTKVENVIIPANTVRISFARDYSALGTGTCNWWNAGLYRGPVYPKFQPAPAIISTDIDAGSKKHKLGVAGSGARIGDGRNLIALNSVGLGTSYASSGGTLSETYNSSDNTYSVTMTAFTLRTGGTSISYNSWTSGHLTPGTQYYFALNDPTYAGGSPSLVTSTSKTGLMSNDGYVYVAQYTTGGSGGSGGGSGAGPICVGASMLLAQGFRASRAHEHTSLQCADKFQPIGKRRAASAYFRTGQCVRLVAENGAACVWAKGTPFELPDGTTEVAENMMGKPILTTKGASIISEIEDVGSQPVVTITTLPANLSYAAGEDSDNLMYGHNTVCQ